MQERRSGNESGRAESRNAAIRQSGGNRGGGRQNEPQIPRAKRRAAHRNRYVVFSIERISGGAPIDRNDLIDAMRYGRLYLLRFDGKYGIAQCSHRYKNEAIRFLNSMGWVGVRENRVRVRTFGTSGTVRAACEKWVPEGSSVRQGARRENSRRPPHGTQRREEINPQRRLSATDSQ